MDYCGRLIHLFLILSVFSSTNQMIKNIKITTNKYGGSSFEKTFLMVVIGHSARPNT